MRQLYQLTIINATLRQTAEEELKALQAAAAARAYRQQSGKKIIQKDGVLFAYKAREAVNKYLEEEAEAAGKAAARKHLAVKHDGSTGAIEPIHTHGVPSTALSARHSKPSPSPLITSQLLS